MTPGVLLSAALFSGVAAQAEPPADRVFFLVIDGLRADEGVESGSTNLPHIWDLYRPKGTVVPTLLNRDSTVTDAAHRGLMAGSRQALPGLPWYPGRVLQRVWTPTVAEAVGASRGCTESSGYIIGNTVFMDSQGRSLYPGFGPCGATEATTQAVSTRSDRDVQSMLMDDLLPTHGIVVFNIHEADKYAHAGRWDEYIDGITRADQIVADFALAATDRDAIFVFSDHGRHEGDDWAGHGDSCSGCRASWFLGWGAGIVAGEVIPQDKYELEDIAATAAHLLGAPMPWARGQVIREALVDPPALLDWLEAMVAPSLSIDESGVAHLVAEVLPGSGGGLGYRRWDGKGWTDWDRFATETHSPESAQVASSGGGLLRTWRGWEHVSGEWALYGQESLDGGLGWGGVARLAPAVPFYAQLSMAPDGQGGFVGLRSTDTEGTGDLPADLALSQWEAGAWRERALDGAELFHVPTLVQTIAHSSGAVSAFAAIPAEHYFPPADDEPDNPGNQNRDIFIAHGHEGAELSFSRLTETPEVSYWPSLAVGSDEILHLAWAERAGASLEEGGWSVRYTRSLDGGQTWATALTVDAAAQEGWRPHVVPVDGGAQVFWIAVDEARSHSIWRAALEDGVLAGREELHTTEDALGQVVAGVVDGGILLAWDALSGEAREVQTLIVPLVVTPTPVDTGDADDTGTSTDTAGAPVGTDGGGCGCGSGSKSGILVGLGLLLFGANRRRRWGLPAVWWLALFLVGGCSSEDLVEEVGEPAESAVTRTVVDPGPAAALPTIEDVAPVAPDGIAPIHVFLFGHHYNGAGGYYAQPDELRRLAQVCIDEGLEADCTLFMDGLLVAHLRSLDPSLVPWLAAHEFPIGYHGEDVHGPYPFQADFSEMLGQSGVDRRTVRAGDDFEAAVERLRARYSGKMVDAQIGADGYLNRRLSSPVDPSVSGGIDLVARALGRDVEAISGNALFQPAITPAFEALTRFTLFQDAGPFSHKFAGRVQESDALIQQVKAFLGPEHTLFWYMGHLALKGTAEKTLPGWGKAGRRVTGAQGGPAGRPSGSPVRNGRSSTREAAPP